MEIDTELMAALAEEADYPGLTHQTLVLDSVEGTAQEWYSVPIKGLEEYVKKYIDHIELSPTADVCKCTWLIHPDDEDLPPVKQRKKRSIEHPRCMVHTKLGFLVGFFAFTFPEPEEATDAPDE